jgi:hypothetical protein
MRRDRARLECRRNGNTVNLNIYLIEKRQSTPFYPGYSRDAAGSFSGNTIL